MKHKKWVISLGGSRIIDDGNVDYNFLRKFEKILKKHKSEKFVVVTGGGGTARFYIKALKKLGESRRKQSMAGIAVTRLHASLLMRLFGRNANEVLPKNMEKVKNLLNKNQVVFCGALRWKDKNTSDGTAADLAGFLECLFINITNVLGVYTSNPKTNKNAKFLKKISWKKFNNMTQKIKFHAGQHFVLDQSAARKIMKKKIPTYIIGSLDDLDNILSGRKFKGSLICG